MNYYTVEDILLPAIPWHNLIAKALFVFVLMCSKRTQIAHTSAKACTFLKNGSIIIMYENPDL